ncbi:MAG: C45 family peptidase [Alphaproteobacteria bacterium]
MPVSGAPWRTMPTLTFRSLTEEAPGAAWRSVFAHGWPGWREWFLRRGGEDRPSLHEAERRLCRHMPEFVAVWESLIDAAGADDHAARFLSFWQPPRYLVNCSQMALVDAEGPLLIRNYDLDPTLNEARVFKTRWKHRAVMGMVEGMAGLADGMNRSGLALSLAFGGRAVCGAGFGVPLILRYVLEVCTNVADAIEALRAVPCHMAYNVTLIDRSGARATVMLAPDHPPFVSAQAHATNHQLGVEWPRHGRLTRTLERAARLESLAASVGHGPCGSCENTLASAFLAPPLFSDRYGEGFGTVYTTAYRPLDGSMTLYWPGERPWRFSFDDYPREVRRITYDAPSQSGTTHSSSLLGAFRQRNQVLEDHDWANLNGTGGHPEEGRYP